MTFSERVADRIKNSRDYRLIMCCDKILTPIYVNMPELFSHHVYRGYSALDALNCCVPGTVVKISTHWHRMRFITNLPDYSELLSTLRSWKKQPPSTREWAYQQTAPGFVVEKLLNPVHTVVKFYGYRGKIKYAWFQRYELHGPKMSDTIIGDATLYKIGIGNRLIKTDARWKTCEMPDFSRPEGLDEMIKISEKLTRDWDFLRVDFILDGDKYYMSELTPYAAGGTNGFSGLWDIELGRHWKCG
jgi:hypothetical protein